MLSLNPVDMNPKSSQLVTRFLLGPATVSLASLLTLSCSEPEKKTRKESDEARDTKHHSGLTPGQVTSSPLDPRSSGSNNETLFHRLDADETGIPFSNRIKPDHPLKHLYATEKVCGGVAVGDLDGDGRPDLFFTNGPEQNRLFLQTGNLTFTDHTTAAGVDGDGRWSAGAALADLDIYLANYAAPNQLYLNRGDATFEEKAAAFGLDYVSASHMPTFCDYDRDGDLDLYLLTNRFHSPTGKPKSEDVLRFKIVDGVGRISFDPPEVGNYFAPYQAGSRDDGRPVFKIQKVAQPDVLFRNDGGRFTNVSREAGIAGTGFGLSATWWDFNQDGWPDLWVGNDFDDPDRVYRNNGDGTFTDVVKTIAPHITWFSMGADFADLNSDARPDFLIADMSGTNHFKQKTNMGSMGAKAEFLRNADPQQYMRNALFLNTGTERFMEGAFLTGLANSDWTWTVKLSDLDCDGRPDVFFTNGMSKNFNESDNEAVLARPGESEWDRHVRAGTAELREQNLAFRNLGNLTFEDVSEAWGLDHVGMSFGTAHADLDRDGDLDLFVGGRQVPGDYPAPAQSVLLINEGGRFQRGNFTLNGLVTSALWSDIDRDGWIDLLVALEWGPVRVFQNKNGQLVDVTESAGLAEFTGWWNGLAGGDFDGDGDLDYVATNFGLNTKYHASPEHPALLYYGDFGTPGSKQIVEAEFEDDILYPGRGRSCSSNAMPHLRESFTTFRDFAAAELVEIYPREKLQGAMKLAATTLESGVFRNETPAGGDLKFTFLPLPRLAQIAPAFGATVTDVDADGIPDLYLAQNFHSPQVETGRMAGGVSQLLLGKGDGTFTPVPAHRSGLVVGGDAASLTLVDLDGSGAPDFVVGINDGPLQVFRNNAADTPLRVRLLGAKGNPTAVGAQVTLVGTDGSRRVVEISAGGSYLSQSPASAHFLLPSDREAAEVHVRWPDGRKSTHAAPSDEGTLEISRGQETMPTARDR